MKTNYYHVCNKDKCGKCEHLSCSCERVINKRYSPKEYSNEMTELCPSCYHTMFVHKLTSTSTK